MPATVAKNCIFLPFRRSTSWLEVQDDLRCGETRNRATQPIRECLSRYKGQIFTLPAGQEKPEELHWLIIVLPPMESGFTRPSGEELRQSLAEHINQKSQSTVGKTTQPACVQGLDIIQVIAVLNKGEEIKIRPPKGASMLSGKLAAGM